MGYRVTPNTLRWWGAYTFWVDTTDSLLSVSWWRAYVLAPLFVLTLAILFFLMLGDRRSDLSFWPSFLVAFSNWLVLGGLIYAVALVIWIIIGVRSISFDVGDMIDSRLVPGTDLSIFGGPVFLVVLTATFFGVWAMVWWIGQFEPQCRGVGSLVSIQESYIWPEIKAMGQCLLANTSSPSLWRTLAVSGPLAVVIVVWSWLIDVLPDEPFAWFSKIGARAARGRDDGRSTLGAVLSGVGEFSSAVGDTVSNIVAFVKGGLWLLLGAFVIYVAWPPGDIFRWIIAGLGIVAAGKGLSYIGPALKTTPTLVGGTPHGDARDATEAEAREATRGSDRSSIDDRRFRT